ncbi:type I-E CRISPR-associated protein Cas6/Cse3/CasE [Amycolatopsis granulosa]|uniref:type I-E CRISPR-associated protein Cas6/Cse3/CasE n=1 Tax=Amycolatopsis granulosa TaxID=185684 RepID=UPI001421418F|nr:type I-E CRISPR-associated protein Cas6/Cse3/CasE [Amycolatopsis granulosa]NIH83759.1 CRISPR system Cascade subunit CasE [Amycolatopsis granulosa]
MFFTRFEFNPARRGAKHLLASPHRLHAAVLAAFPGEHSPVTKDGGRVLWRLDHPAHRALLYIVSPAQPDLTHLVEEAGWPTTHTWDTRDYTPLLGRLAATDTYAFRLTANPTFSRAQPEGRGKRLGHVTVNQQLGWFLARTERHGFTIPPVAADGEKEPDATILSRTVHKFTRHGRTVTLATATYGGTLEVTDPDALCAALTRGIGPAKGYGCGLLTLAPAT